MSVKYKIENSKKNKNLIGDEVSVSKIKKPGGRGPNGPKQQTTRQMVLETRQILVDFIKEVRTQFKSHGWTK